MLWGNTLLHHSENSHNVEKNGKIMHQSRVANTVRVHKWIRIYKLVDHFRGRYEEHPEREGVVQELTGGI